MDPALQELLASAAPDEVRAVIVRLHDAHRVPEQLACVSRFGPIVTGRVRAGDVLDLHADPRVASVKAPRLSGAEPPMAEARGPAVVAGTERAGPRRARSTGRGCVIGVVDFGIDWAHPAFAWTCGSRSRSRPPPPARSRLVAIWDQHVDDATRTRSIERYGYGRCFERAEIERALATARPYEALHLHPARRSLVGGGHGTHVLGIAARHAPGAELAGVELASSAPGPDVGLGDSSRLLEAIDWLERVANGRPCIVCLSLGAMAGAHDGTSLVELAMDARLRASRNLSIVCSAGNYRRDRAHARGFVAPGRSAEVAWLVPPRDRTANEIELWYSGREEMCADVRPPSGPVRRLPLGTTATLRMGRDEIGRAYHRRREPNSLDHMIEIWLEPRAPSGRWSIELHAVSVDTGRFDAWIERDPAGLSGQSSFDGGVRETGTLGSIATGRETLVVGALDARGRPSVWSSLGPTRDGRAAPRVWAPGTNVLAPAATPAGESRPRARYARVSGTSMAAPRVAAELACLHEALGPGADARRVRALMRDAGGEGVGAPRAPGSRVDARRALP